MNAIIHWQHRNNWSAKWLSTTQPPHDASQPHISDTFLSPNHNLRLTTSLLTSSTQLDCAKDITTTTAAVIMYQTWAVAT